MNRFYNVLMTILIWFACACSPQEFPPSNIGPRTEAVQLEKYQEVRYVLDDIGSDENRDGSSVKSWRSINHALDEITDAGPDKRYAVLVSQGSYNLDTIHLKEYIDLYGGFETSKWERDIFKYRSILSGDEKRRVIVGSNNAQLDGFVITEGAIRGKGAGLYCNSVSPTITNNIFLANKTLAPIPWNPKYLHETANDGGAIYCENDASPIIENNLLIKNATENGRGAAITFHSKCNGRIANNVFLNNTTGLTDPMRSSDGGAISIFDWSSPVIENNVILNNKALASNDAGGLFVALWSSPVIRKNIFVGNECSDDAGALFVGGQEHRYDRPLDYLPGKEDFFVKIQDNIFIGNTNPSKNSGAMRFTMESRGLFSNNIVAHNSGIYFQRSEVTIENNTILDNFLFIETKEGLKPGIIKNNIIWGDFNLGTKASVLNNNIRYGYNGEGNLGSPPEFINDWIHINAEAALFDRQKFVTNLFVSTDNFKQNELVNRIIKAGGKWGVIKSNSAKEIEVWGDFSGEIDLTVLPSYQLRQD